MKKLTNKKRFFTASIATLLLLGASTAGFVSCKTKQRQNTFLLVQEQAQQQHLLQQNSV